MRPVRFAGLLVLSLLLVVFDARRAGAQSASVSASSDADQQHEHGQHGTGGMWQFMQEGVLFGVFNHQGGVRGSDEFVAPNWWMGMATRSLGGSRLTLTGMLSLDPATVGKDGYAELFQTGEALNGLPLIDRQHPHDFFMQLAAAWRLPLTSSTDLTLAGGPAGEPALGPIAFMHRASAAEYPFAPLSHHTFDSTHVSYGVVTAALAHGPFVIEGSVFNGREPDDNRWDFDFGPLDSVSGRLWYKPTDHWEFQVSTGHLKHPEELEPDDIQRTTASGSWMRPTGSDFTAMTVGYGVNTTHDVSRHAAFGEVTRRFGDNTLFTRIEVLQVETDLLLSDAVPFTAASTSRKDTVGAFTMGATRDVLRFGGFEGAVGAAATFYAVPGALNGAYGNHPVSLQGYFRLRPPVSGMGRMWNMRMTQPMGHRM
jgi:hypothetical protein